MHVKALQDSLAATSRDAGCGFSIAWTGQKGEKSADFVFVRL